ncbi:MAG: hypothetical protein ACO1SX_27930 [Actinomycetota bacterium]
MTRHPYRKASTHTGLWLTLLLLGVAGQIAVMFVLHGRKHWLPHEAWILVIGILPFVLMLFLAVAILRRLNRRRQQRMAERLTALGFQVNLNPTPEDKAAFFQALEPLKSPLGLDRGADALKWYAVQGQSQGQLRLFEYQFVTGSGKYTEEHNRTVVLWPGTLTDPPGARLGQLPGFLALRMGWLQRRPNRKTELKAPGFADVARKWSLVGDAGTGARFLTPAVRAELDRSPMGEVWSLGGGWACCGFRHLLDADNLPRFLERAERILTLAN